MNRIIIHIVTLFAAVNVSAQDVIIHKTQTDIPYYPDSMDTDNYMKNRCKLDIRYPENRMDFATLVWFHGGGLREGEKYFPEALLHLNLCIVSANYRLFPKVNAPAYIRDAAAAVAWVFKNIAEYGGDPDKIFISGHSAGGYLTSMVGLDKRWLAEYGIDANKIAGLIPLSGHTITHFTIRQERGLSGTKIVIDDLAPLYHIRSDAPPLLLITGDRELELLGRYEENAYFFRMMKIVGHTNTRLYELQGYGHMMTQPAFPLLIKEIERVSEQNLRNKYILAIPGTLLSWTNERMIRTEKIDKKVVLSTLWIFVTLITCIAI